MDTNLQKELLIRKRIFPLTEKITKGLITNMENSLIQMALEAPKKAVTLIVDSDGGDVRSALNGYDFLKSMPFEVNAAIIGACHSSSLTIIAGCKLRTAITHSRFLFHAMTSELTIKVTEDFEEQIKRGADNLKISYEQVLKVQSEAYGLSREQLIELRMVGDKYDVRLTAEQAKERGVIHNIVERFDFLDEQ